jgi:hypothetical protein
MLLSTNQYVESSNEETKNSWRVLDNLGNVRLEKFLLVWTVQNPGMA